MIKYKNVKNKLQVTNQTLKPQLPSGIRVEICVCVSVGQEKRSAQDELGCGSAQVTCLQDTYQPLIGQLGRHADEVS